MYSVITTKHLYIIDIKQRLKQSSEGFLSEICYQRTSRIDLNKSVKNKTRILKTGSISHINTNFSVLYEAVTTEKKNQGVFYFAFSMPLGCG